MPITPIAGGDTPESAWKRMNHIGGNPSSDDGTEMFVDGEEMKGHENGVSNSHSNMSVISGKDGLEVPIPNLCTPDYTIKIGLTLYKVQQNIYLLDFQKMTGDAFSFMTLCANIITELKTLSAASKQQQALLAQQQAALAKQQQQAALQKQGLGAGLAPSPSGQSQRVQSAVPPSH